MNALIALAVAISASTGVGMWSRGRWSGPSERLAERMIWVVLWVITPPCVFVNVAHFDVASGDGLALAIGLGCLLSGGLLSWFLATRVMRLPDRRAGAVICCSIVANTGYYGIPATLVVYGSGAVAGAATWDALLTIPVTFLLGFGIGAAYGVGERASFGERARSFARHNPVLWILVPALLFPAAAIPGWALDVSHFAFVALLPVGFYVLGVNLGHGPDEGPGEPLLAPVAAAVGIRILIVPALFAGICGAVGGVPGSYLVQAAAPIGINSLIIATVFDLDRRLTAAAVAVSTAAAMLGALVAGLAG